ncbi:hypothetical protein [Paenibacillus sp.]|nr:hypothetical protein [Paenibacillus sp.]
MNEQSQGRGVLARYAQIERQARKKGAERTIENFPAFCGFSTSELNYDNY